METRNKMAASVFCTQAPELRSGLVFLYRANKCKVFSIVSKGPVYIGRDTKEKSEVYKCTASLRGAG